MVDILVAILAFPFYVLGWIAAAHWVICVSAFHNVFCVLRWIGVVCWNGLYIGFYDFLEEKENNRLNNEYHCHS